MKFNIYPQPPMSEINLLDGFYDGQLFQVLFATAFDLFMNSYIIIYIMFYFYQTLALEINLQRCICQAKTFLQNQNFVGGSKFVVVLYFWDQKNVRHKFPGVKHFGCQLNLNLFCFSIVRPAPSSECPHPEAWPAITYGHLRGVILTFQTLTFERNS